AKAMGVSQVGGALVSDVSADSPAERAGLKRGDIIEQVNGKAVTDSNQLRMNISMMHPDSRVSLKVRRDGSERDLSATLGEMPNQQASAENNSEGTKSSFSGVSVEDLDRQTARQLGLPANTTGVVVTGINPSSAAADTDLHKGDVIQEVNHQPVHNTADFERAMHNNAKQENLLLVNRQGHTLYVAV
ncbi:MAG TPA: PDZ domain-containing protein, partial [Bryobacteraceae bacterium]|nr:PDZ domain-containing protein [Bryobacteraceae bacterium]